MSRRTATVKEGGPPPFISSLKVSVLSNRTLKERIAEAIRKFETGNIGLAALKSAVLDNGSVLEAMPYSLIKDMEELEYKLTISQFHDEGGELSPQQALYSVKAWFGNCLTRGGQMPNEWETRDAYLFL